MEEPNRKRTVEAPPRRAQLSPAKLVGMSLGSLRQQSVASMLQFATIAATAAFLMFVLGEIIGLRASLNLERSPDVGGAEARMAHLCWILVISLLVCAISNVTSMLLSVTRRFREIGTMKCLGAFDGSILLLFLAEAVMLAGAGAFCGTLLGLVVSMALAVVAHSMALLSAAVIWQFSAAALAALAVVTFLSFLGAVYPAWKASRMLPVEAMRRP